MRYSLKYIIFIIILISIMIVFLGSALSRFLYPSKLNPMNLYSVQLASPEEDLSISLAQQDRRFVGIMNVGLVIPGIQGGPLNEEVKRYGYRIVTGTSDVISAPWQGKLQSRAMSYAERYNRLLMKELERSKPSSKSTNEIL